MHPILQEYSGQIPKTIPTYQFIQDGKSFEEIARAVGGLNMIAEFCEAMAED